MKFLYQDLLNFFVEKPSKDLLSEKLFQLGHEHEINGDIFDMELTPNRGDCLSLLGLARDLNIFFNKVNPINIFEGDIEGFDLDFENLSTECCPKISFLQIEIEEKVIEYKSYLENYFTLLGNNKTNFFTDVSNYISYEMGQPTHCFSSDKIKGKLTFQDKQCDETFKTLLGSEIKLKEKNSVFSVDDKIISLAGVMGGISTSCSSETKKAIIECAYFNPEAIIGKTIKYNLVSDAAYKFERGVDISSQERVLRRFIAIVKDHALIKKIKINSYNYNDVNNSQLTVDVSKINKILGINLKENEYLSYLSKLGFDVKDKINIPFYRHDISSQNDLAEEIARLIGYNNISSKPIEISKKTKKTEDKSNKVKTILVQNGFFEVINFPFTSNKSEHSIEIDNPLDSNKRFLRTSLKESLLENLLYNERRQKDSIKLFEISDIYSKNGQLNQEKKLGIIICGRKGHNHNEFSKKLDADYLKMIFDKNISLRVEEISRADLKTKKKEKIFYTEFSISDLNNLSGSGFIEENFNFIKYEPISEFPSSVRDFSFSIKDANKYSRVIEYISSLQDENLKESYIFDFYENKKLGEIKVGVRLIFQSTTSTLSDEEIQKGVERIIKPMLDLDGVSVPGL